MRIFDNLIEAQKEILRSLIEMGLRVHPETMQDRDVADDPDYATVELVNWTYAVTQPTAQGNAELLDYLELSQAYYAQELTDRFSLTPLNPGFSWQIRHETWAEFLEEGNFFAYTYSARLNPYVQRVLDLLRAKPNTRQAILPVFDPSQDMENLGGLHRVPCSMYYHFFIRNQKLVMNYVMRSCDLLVHWPYDATLAIGMQLRFADELEIPIGRFFHHIDSLHIYAKDAPEGVF